MENKIKTKYILKKYIEESKFPTAEDFFVRDYRFDYPEILGTFLSEEEGLKNLAKYQNKITPFSSKLGTLYELEVYALHEERYELSFSDDEEEEEFLDEVGAWITWSLDEIYFKAKKYLNHSQYDFIRIEELKEIIHQYLKEKQFLVPYLFPLDFNESERINKVLNDLEKNLKGQFFEIKEERFFTTEYVDVEEFEP